MFLTARWGSRPRGQSQEQSLESNDGNPIINLNLIKSLEFLQNLNFEVKYLKKY
jgi:hypothetical protein